MVNGYLGRHRLGWYENYAKDNNLKQNGWEPDDDMNNISQDMCAVGSGRQTGRQNKSWERPRREFLI